MTIYIQDEIAFGEPPKNRADKSVYVYTAEVQQHWHMRNDFFSYPEKGPIIWWQKVTLVQKLRNSFVYP